MSDKAKGRVLLPSTILPTRYDIKITPNLETFTFVGEQTIVVETSDDIDKECKEVTMHAKELCFISCSFSVGDAVTVEAIEVNIIYC